MYIGLLRNPIDLCTMYCNIVGIILPHYLHFFWKQNDFLWSKGGGVWQIMMMSTYTLHIAYKTILVGGLGVRKDNVINICGKRVIRNSVGLLFSKPCLLFVWISVPPFDQTFHMSLKQSILRCINKFIFIYYLIILSLVYLLSICFISSIYFIIDYLDYLCR